MGLVQCTGLGLGQVALQVFGSTALVMESQMYLTLLSIDYPFVVLCVT